MHAPAILRTLPTFLAIQEFLLESKRFVRAQFDPNGSAELHTLSTIDSLFVDFDSRLIGAFSTPLRMGAHASRQADPNFTTYIVNQYAATFRSFLDSADRVPFPAEVSSSLDNNQLTLSLAQQGLPQSPSTPEVLDLDEVQATPSTAFGIAQQNLIRVLQRIAIVHSCVSLLHGFQPRPALDGLVQELMRALFQKEQRFRYVSLQMALLSNDPHLLATARKALLSQFSSRYSLAQHFTLDGVMPGRYPCDLEVSFQNAIGSQNNQNPSA